MNAFAGNVFGSQPLAVKLMRHGRSDKPGQANCGSSSSGIRIQPLVQTCSTPDMNGYGSAYAYFVQDNWKVNPRLTLNHWFALWYHPSCGTTNTTARIFIGHQFLFPAITLVQGAVVVRNQQRCEPHAPHVSRGNRSYADSSRHQQAGVSSALVTVTKSDFSPRLGFAWRLLAMIRPYFAAGWGRLSRTAPLAM